MTSKAIAKVGVGTPVDSAVQALSTAIGNLRAGMTSYPATDMVFTGLLAQVNNLQTLAATLDEAIYTAESTPAAVLTPTSTTPTTPTTPTPATAAPPADSVTTATAALVAVGAASVGGLAGYAIRGMMKGRR